MGLGKKHKTVLSFAIALLLVLILVGGYWFFIRKQVLDKRNYVDIEKVGVLRIVAIADRTGYYISDDTVAGFNHDLLLALQQYTDVKFEVSIQNSIENGLEDLGIGRYDVVAGNIPINANLKSIYSFTEPIVRNKLILVQRKMEYNDSVLPIRSHLELAGKSIYVAKNSPSLFRLKNLSSEIGDTIFVKEDDLYQAEQLAMMVSAGEIDYTVCDEKTARILAEKLPQLDIKTDIGFTHLEAWAVRKDSPVLLDSLNAWINRFKQTEEYRKILDRYYK